MEPNGTVTSEVEHEAKRTAAVMFFPAVSKAHMFLKPRTDGGSEFPWTWTPPSGAFVPVDNGASIKRPAATVTALATTTVGHLIAVTTTLATTTGRRRTLVPIYYSRSCSGGGGRARCTRKAPASRLRHRPGPASAAASFCRSDSNPVTNSRINCRRLPRPQWPVDCRVTNVYSIESPAPRFGRQFFIAHPPFYARRPFVSISRSPLLAPCRTVRLRVGLRLC